MQREWCPAQTTERDVIRHADSTAGCAWQRSVAAANSDISAFHQAESVPRKVLSVPRFSASVVASRANKAFIPFESTGEANFRIAASSFGDATVAMSSAFLSLADDHCTNVSTVAVPANCADALLSQLARHRTCGGPEVRNVMLLPSLAGTVAVEEVLTALGYNHTFTQSLTAVSLCGGTTTSSPNLVRFIADAKSLRCLGLPHSHMAAHVPELCEALAESSVEHISLANNDIGVDNEHAENSAAGLAALLKQSKFLLSLDLSGNGFAATAVQDMMAALADSDTTLTPTDLPPKPEVDVIALNDLVSAESDNDDGEADGDGSDAEDSYVADGSEPASGGEEERDTDGGDASGRGEADELEEGEEGAEEGSDDAEAMSASDSIDDEEREQRAREAYARGVARVARETAREEARMRRTLVRQYVRDTRDSMAPLYYSIVALRAKEEEARVEAFCRRRSGWSRLQWLSLSGNNVGDRGAVGLAAALLDEVKLGEEQVREAEDSLREGAQKLMEVLVDARRNTLVGEAKERASLQQAFQVSLEALERRAMYGDDDEDDYAAPDVVMTNIDDGSPDNADDGAGDVAGDQYQGDDGTNVDDEGIETDLTQWVLPVSSTKRGMNSLRFLDLSGCALTNRGLKHLAKSLETNRSVEVLVLRDNRFGRSGGNNNKPENREDSATAPSGIVALAQALCSNTAMRSLDLSYCHLEAPSLRLVSEALRENDVLQTLRLEGNGVGQSDSAAANGATSCLLELLQAVCEGGLQHLSLSHNNLESSLWQEEIEALCEASLKLESLELSNTNLTGAHVAKWLDALQDRECGLTRLHLARNTFADAVDGQILRELLTRCPRLVELCLDDNTALQSSGVAALLGADGKDLPSIRQLRCCRTGLTVPVLGDDTPVLAPSLLHSLTYLDLGDVVVESTDLFEGWMSACKAHCHQLEYLSFWSRGVSMEGHLSLARELVEALPTLLYADFGVLLRFDSPRDLEDDLGCIERELVRRRAQRPSS